MINPPRNIAKIPLLNYSEGIHYDPMLERQILGICMNVRGMFNLYCEVSRMIQIKDVFYYEVNQLIFEAMERCAERFEPLDETFLKIELAKVKHPVGDPWGYELGQCVNDIHGGMVLPAYYVRMCLKAIEFYIKRKQLAARFDIDIEEDPLAANIRLHDEIKEVTRFKSDKDWETMEDLLAMLHERRMQGKAGKVFGVQTGFTKLDQVTGGLQTGFIVIFARPSMGKTSFALSMILNMAKAGIPIGLINLEMPQTQLAARIMAALTAMPFINVFNYNEATEAKITAASESAKKLPIYISSETKCTYRDIRYKAEKLIRLHGCKIIFIDYLQLMEVETKKGEQRYVAVGNLSRDLKLMSKELDIPVVAMAQVNRESEKGDAESKPAKISQLRESGNIEQDADMGIGIDRPYKRGVKEDEHGQSTINLGIIDIQKHRNGITTTLPIFFDPDTMLFKNLPQDEIIQPMEYDNPRIQSPRPTEAPIIDLPF